ncbi:MAG: hypothetical protein M9921_11415 [Fimbriimonadaceae bacterium]|nr:hypothetical protein [Chthonomonadaceae bacterium]MCO5297455.1 hypothetical protein [Fimbriimonadaceae bacterium]
MKPGEGRTRQRSTVFVALLLFNLVLVLLQLWLFVSVLEGVVGGGSAMAVPAAVASLGLFAVNVWMLRGLYRL